MDDALLVCMLYPSAYRNKKLQPLPHRKLLALAVIGKLLSHDQFHHEKRPTRFCCSGVQHPGDVGVVHHGQRLPLGLEARHHGLRIHTVFEDLERDPAMHRLLLLRYIHRRKTPLADLLEQLVPSDYGPHASHLYLARIAREISLIAAKPSRANSQCVTNVLTRFAMREILRRNTSETRADNG